MTSQENNINYKRDFCFSNNYYSHIKVFHKINIKNK